ncbi:DUF2169 domain-containing protein [Paracoccus sp. ME4]|uniref:DUF2169 family type VI secretion system accessory protein n=1 Tax=Paracoccus sp. ME4 TaxID=3138066 RepID=UPI00398B989F
MWTVRNTTGYAGAGTFLRDAEGHEHWCVGVRATFHVDPGGTVRMADRQIPVTMVPRYGGHDNDVLLADDDIIPCAPTTDILLRGWAQPDAPADAPVALSASVGALSKRAVLHPPRRARLIRGRWRVEPTGGDGAASLGWEASFGGLLPDAGVAEPPDNPLGTGLWLRAPRLFEDGAETDLPRIEGAGMDCARDPQASRSVGFGPVPRWWRSRIALAGTFDAAWRRERSPAMPVDHDPGFLMSAPRDQWPDKPLVGGEPVRLEGFTPGMDWRFRLPQALFQAETQFGPSVVPLPMRLARIDLWPSDGRLSMLWLGTLACDGQDQRIGATRLSLRQLSGVTS